MAKYKVLVIALSVKNNKIAKAGDIVDETQLNSPTYLLVQNGFLKQIEAEVESEKEVEKSDLEVEVEEIETETVEEVSNEEKIEAEVENLEVISEEVQPVQKKVEKKPAKK